MIKKKRRLITAALPYVNALPHLGNVIGSHLPADIYARFCRLVGEDVLFVGGSDEHGTPIEVSAEKIGVDIQTFKDVIHTKHKEIYVWFNISYDIYSRTSTKVHYELTQEFFKQLQEKNLISEDEVEMFYSEEEKRFLPDRYIMGTCPHCSYEEANGDQCEKCGSLLTPKELVNPKSTLSQTQLILKKTKHLFFRLDKLESDLREWITTTLQCRSQVKKMALGWMNEGLQPRSISRDSKNGVPIPLEEFKEKVFYVWFDAPIGYISATKEVTESWRSYWSDESSVVHFLGKDNIPFHTIFWPGMLMGNGSFTLPDHVVGLQYLNFEGGKFSKSKQRGVFCEHLPSSSLDPDVLRCYLTSLIPETGDTNFEWDDFRQRSNSELIGTFGNFINRTLGLINTKCNGVLHKPSQDGLEKEDQEFVEQVNGILDEIEQAYSHVELRLALKKIYELAAKGNVYLNANEPWKLLETNIQRTNQILYLCCHVAKLLAIVALPIIPCAAKKIWEQLGLEGTIDQKVWKQRKEFTFSDQHTLNENIPLFQKIDSKELEHLKTTLAQTSDLETFF